MALVGIPLLLRHLSAGAVVQTLFKKKEKTERKRVVTTKSNWFLLRPLARKYLKEKFLLHRRAVKVPAL